MEFDEFIPVPAKRIKPTRPASSKIKAASLSAWKWIKTKDNAVALFTCTWLSIMFFLFLGFILCLLKDYPEYQAGKAVEVLQLEIIAARADGKIAVIPENNCITISAQDKTINATEKNITELSLFLFDSKVINAKEALMVQNSEAYITVWNGNFVTRSTKQQAIKEAKEMETAETTLIAKRTSLSEKL